MANIFDEEPTLEVNSQSIDSEILNNNSIDHGGLHAMRELHDSDGFQLPADINFYDNNLLQLAEPILSVLLSVPRQSKPYDLNYFRLQLLDLLKDFKYRAINSDYHPSVIEKSVYSLCAAIDEEIAHTTWGKEGGWVNHSLLSSMFTQRNGGEIFFVLLDKACQQPKLLIDFIELQYVLIMLGFKGKYSETDKNELYEIKSYVFTLIEHYHKDSKSKLPKDETNTSRGKPFVSLRYRYIFISVLLICLILIVSNQIRYMVNNESISYYIDNTSSFTKSKFKQNFTELEDSKLIITNDKETKKSKSSNKKTK